jgi:hypothetical protein
VGVVGKAWVPVLVVGGLFGTLLGPEATGHVSGLCFWVSLACSVLSPVGGGVGGCGVVV